MTKKNDLQIGDVVRRQGTHRDMTVRTLDGDAIECNWFEGTALHQEWFRGAELKLIRR